MDNNLYINLKFRIYIKDNNTYYLKPNSDKFKFFEYVNITDDLPNTEYIAYNKEVIKSRMEKAETVAESVEGGKRMINNHTLRKTLKKLKRKINKTLRVI